MSVTNEYGAPNYLSDNFLVSADVSIVNVYLFKTRAALRAAIAMTGNINNFDYMVKNFQCATNNIEKDNVPKIEEIDVWCGGMARELKTKDKFTVTVNGFTGSSEPEFFEYVEQLCNDGSRGPWGIVETQMYDPNSGSLGKKIRHPGIIASSKHTGDLKHSQSLTLNSDGFYPVRLS